MDGPPLDKVNTEAQLRANRIKGYLRDRRRVKIAIPSTGETRKRTAETATGTTYPNRIAPVLSDTEPLKPGIFSTKIGGDVLKGNFKGWKLYTLTLEERATCPRSCYHWRTCYGNNMSKALRYEHGPALEKALIRQVRALTSTHYGVLIRLHVLGDFYSWRYLCLWADLIDTHRNLAVFGFTAHPETSKIGAGVSRLREVYPNHFAVRTSGRTGRWGAATVGDDLRAPRIGDAIVCPEQLDAIQDKPKGRHCGNCALCWHTDNPIIFREH